MQPGKGLLCYNGVAIGVDLLQHGWTVKLFALQLKTKQKIQVKIDTEPIGLMRNKVQADLVI